MNIMLEDGSIILNTIPITTKDEITEGCRLFYELGFKRNSNWIRTGVFKEITEPEKYKQEEDRLNREDFIKHHNFVVFDSSNSERKLREMAELHKQKEDNGKSDFYLAWRLCYEWMSGTDR